MSGKLNPDITPVDIGVEELRTINIYPLSIKDHTEKLPQILVEAYSTFQEELATTDDIKGMSNEQGMSLLEKLKTILYENIQAILVLVCKKEELPKEDELTSNQLFKIAETIFVVNYEGVLKNSIDLFKRIKELKNQ